MHVYQLGFCMDNFGTWRLIMSVSNLSYKKLHMRFQNLLQKSGCKMLLQLYYTEFNDLSFADGHISMMNTETRASTCTFSTKQCFAVQWLCILHKR